VREWIGTKFVHKVLGQADESDVEITSASPAFRPGKYVTFRVGRQDFAMDAARVRAILPLHDLVTLATPHPWLRGFAALGVHEFPVVDLQRKFHLPHASRGREPCIFAVAIEAAGVQRLAGFVADRVSAVVHLRERDFHNGVAHAKGRPRRLLDPDQILTEGELRAVALTSLYEGECPSPLDGSQTDHVF
jgi:purine-binding chemotaxis protein CheW